MTKEEKHPVEKEERVTLSFKVGNETKTIKISPKKLEALQLTMQQRGQPSSTSKTILQVPETGIPRYAVGDVLKVTKDLILRQVGTPANYRFIPGEKLHIKTIEQRPKEEESVVFVDSTALNVTCIATVATLEGHTKIVETTTEGKSGAKMESLQQFLQKEYGVQLTSPWKDVIEQSFEKGESVGVLIFDAIEHHTLNNAVKVGQSIQTLFEEIIDIDEIQREYETGKLGFTYVKRALYWDFKLDKPYIAAYDCKNYAYTYHLNSWSPEQGHAGLNTPYAPPSSSWSQMPKPTIGIKQRADVVDAIMASDKQSAEGIRGVAAMEWLKKQDGKTLEKWVTEIGKTPTHIGKALFDCKMNRKKLQDAVEQTYSTKKVNLPLDKMVTLVVKSFVGHLDDEAVQNAMNNFNVAP